MNRYTLQRINHDVFKNPEGLMDNFSRVTRHLRSKIEEEGSGIQCLTLVPAKDGRFFHKDSNGNYWRVTKFVDGGRSFEVPEDIHQAYEAYVGQARNCTSRMKRRCTCQADHGPP